MDVGLQLIFSSYGWDTDVTDGTVYEQELRLADLAEQLGFDAVWPTEHHFFVLPRQSRTTCVRRRKDNRYQTRYCRGHPALERTPSCSRESCPARYRVRGSSPFRNGSRTLSS